MDTPRRKPWIRPALLVGCMYVLVGRLFALPVNDVRAWRLAAWVVSAAIYAAHLGYEWWRLGNSPRSTALHLSAAVAAGAFGLAAAATLHSWLAPSASQPWQFLLALVAWPAGTAPPAFLVAWFASTILTRLHPPR